MYIYISNKNQAQKAETEFINKDALNINTVMQIIVTKKRKLPL